MRPFDPRSNPSMIYRDGYDAGQHDMLAALAQRTDGEPVWTAIGDKRNRRDFALWTLAHNLAVAGAIAGERLRVLDAFAPRVKLPPRACTCLGSCRGADGLAPGWRCALAKEQG